ncbi:MAG: ABC transporter ATP-binding protein [Planctomycetota bacterium]|nr:ABC transporter ATP-binding protein [Planctomycetota bacterium]
MSQSALRAAVEVVNLSHAFGSRWAVRNASFSVPAGSLHGFVGPNGAGKTTTLKSICTLLQPHSGVVRVFGLDVVAQAHEVRRRLGFMPDHFSMYRRMTVFEYLDFFAAAYGIPMAQRDKVIGDVLTITDMDGRRNDLVGGLSRGMQQRVALSRVLVSDPELLLLDEPASGLDPRARIELMEILRELQRMGKTIFISSHILSELAELCDSVTIIDGGKIKYSGSISGLLKTTTENQAFRIGVGAGEPDHSEKLAGLPGVLRAERVEGTDEYRVEMEHRPGASNILLKAMMELGAIVQSFGEDRRHLNDAFMDLTKGGLN